MNCKEVYMRIEYFIYIAIAVLSILSILYIPKEKIRKALLSLLAFQTSTWFTSIILVQRNKITYSVRELSKANSTSFSFEFFILPLLCIFFNLHFPEDKSFYEKLRYYISFLLPFSLVEYFTEKYMLILK